MKTDDLGKTRDFLDPSVIASLTPIPFMSRRPMQGSVSGRHMSPHRGSSIEFAEYRKYVPGDDPRRLDWRAVGRSDRFYVKEFEADTNLRCVFVLDTSGSMAFETATKRSAQLAASSEQENSAASLSNSPPAKTKPPLSKIAYARSLAGTLAYLAVEQGDAVGLALVADTIIREIPARRNAAHLSHIFDAIEDSRPHGATQLPEILHQLAETVSRRALFLVISDLFIEPSVLRGCFEHLRFRQHDVGVFHLLAPEELNFTFQRPTRFLDMEGGPALFVEPVEIVDRYQKAMTEYLESIQKLMRETSTDYQRVSIDEPYADILSRFLIGRASRRSGR
jgi:uncharacterized protein (DUF58 family)